MDIKLYSNHTNADNYAHFIKSIVLPVSVAVVLAFVSLYSPLLAGAIGVSTAQAGLVAQKAYAAWKAGSSIRTAVAAATGPGFLVSIAVNFLLSWGIGSVLGSSWLQSL